MLGEREILTSFKDLLSEKCLGKKSLNEILSHRGCSLTWFVVEELYGSFRGSFIAKHGYSDIQSTTIFQRLQKSIYRVRFLWLFVVTIYLLVRYAVRCGLVGVIVRPKLKNYSIQNDAGGRILLQSASKCWKPVYTYKTSQKTDGDFYLHNIIEILQGQGYDSVLIESEGFMPNLKKTIARIIKGECLSTPWELFLNIRIIFHSIKEAFKVLKELDLILIEGNDTVKSTIEPVVPLIAPRLVFAVLYLEAAERIITRIRPDVVVLRWEFDPLGKALIYTSKKHGIKTVAVEHGLIFEYYVEHFRTPEESSDIQKGSLRGCLIPDKTLVLGRLDAHKLIHGDNYHRSRVLVIGDPKMDFLAKFYLDKETLMKRMQLDPTKKTVLFASQVVSPSLPWQRKLEKFRILCQSMKKVGSRYPLQLVLKPHPEEDRKSLEPLLKTAKGFGFENVYLAVDANIYDAAAICDLFVTINSTSALDAVGVGKPTILLGRLDQLLGQIGYSLDSRGDSFPKAESELELTPLIERMLNISPQGWQEIRSRIISEYLFKLDGKSSMRAAEAIINELSSRRQSEKLEL